MRASFLYPIAGATLAAVALGVFYVGAHRLAPTRSPPAATDTPARAPAAATDKPAPPAALAAGAPLKRPIPEPPIAGERTAIEAALALHGNPRRIVPSFFTTLAESMERTGLSHDAAQRVAAILAGNPRLDELADMTIAGCLPSYTDATGFDFDKAVAALSDVIERPERVAAAGSAADSVVPPELQRRIAEKLQAGNRNAAQRLVERALLDRFNPGLGAKIMVPE